MLQFNSVWRRACLVLMWLTAAGWKTPGKYWRFKWSFAMTTGAWCLLINRWGGKGGRKSVSDRNLSDSAHRDIKKSQSLRSHTRAQIACGVRYKRFALKCIASDIKQEKLGQFSICCGGKRDSYFFVGGGGQALSLWHLGWIPEKKKSLSRSVWASSILQRVWATGCEFTSQKTLNFLSK